MSTNKGRFNEFLGPIERRTLLRRVGMAALGTIFFTARPALAAPRVDPPTADIPQTLDTPQAVQEFLGMMDLTDSATTILDGQTYGVETRALGDSLFKATIKDNYRDELVQLTAQDQRANGSKLSTIAIVGAESDFPTGVQVGQNLVYVNSRLTSMGLLAPYTSAETGQVLFLAPKPDLPLDNLDIIEGIDYGDGVRKGGVNSNLNDNFLSLIVSGGQDLYTSLRGRDRYLDFIFTIRPIVLSSR